MPKINDGIKELLGTTPQIGMNIAQGMSPAKAAVSAIGASIFEKIIGPAGVMLGTFVGVSRALRVCARSFQPAAPGGDTPARPAREKPRSGVAPGGVGLRGSLAGEVSQGARVDVTAPA